MTSSWIRIGTAALALAALALTGCKDRQAQRQEAISHEVDDKEREAASRYPNLSRSEAIRAVAIERAAKRLGNAGSDEQKSRVAAHMFFGFYYTNVKGRAEYCTQHGTDITPFVSAFTQAHEKGFERARTIIAAEGEAPESIWPQMRSQMMPLVEQNMKDIAKGAHVRVEDSCNLFNAKAELIVQRLKLTPGVESALMQGP